MINNGQPFENVHGQVAGVRDSLELPLTKFCSLESDRDYASQNESYRVRSVNIWVACPTVGCQSLGGPRTKMPDQINVKAWTNAKVGCIILHAQGELNAKIRATAFGARHDGDCRLLLSSGQKHACQRARLLPRQSSDRGIVEAAEAWRATGTRIAACLSRCTHTNRQSAFAPGGAAEHI